MQPYPYTTSVVVPPNIPNHDPNHDPNNHDPNHDPNYDHDDDDDLSLDPTLPNPRGVFQQLVEIRKASRKAATGNKATRLGLELGLVLAPNGISTTPYGCLESPLRIPETGHLPNPNAH